LHCGRRIGRHSGREEHPGLFEETPQSNHPDILMLEWNSGTVAHEKLRIR